MTTRDGLTEAQETLAKLIFEHTGEVLATPLYRRDLNGHQRRSLAILIEEGLVEEDADGRVQIASIWRWHFQRLRQLSR